MPPAPLTRQTLEDTPERHPYAHISPDSSSTFRTLTVAKFLTSISTTRRARRRSRKFSPPWDASSPITRASTGAPVSNQGSAPELTNRHTTSSAGLSAPTPTPTR